MRWLLFKDLQILRRSPLQAFLLIVYPVLIAVLVGFAISRGPEKPRVAFVNQVPKGTAVQVGGSNFSTVGARNRLCSRIECVRVDSRAEAISKVESGDVLGALILPRDLAEQVNSLSSLNAGHPKVEVIVNQEDPVKARLVDDRISSLLAQANLVIARQVARSGSQYLDLILNGGHFDFFGQSFQILGLKRAPGSCRRCDPWYRRVPRGRSTKLPGSRPWPATTSTSRDPFSTRWRSRSRCRRR